MQQFADHDIAEIRSRIDQIHDMLAKSAGEDQPRPDPAFGGDEAQPQLIDQLSLSIQLRRMRKSHFGTAQMSGAVWDMMLDLMLANANGRTLSASDLATGAGVPLSSGLRMIAALEGAGLARRTIDERDRRRTIVRLTEAGTEKMASYFDKMNAAVRSGYRRAA
ncbi:MAG TPA: winged helix DNA-binding protein [Sphingopyxis sp.]|uniref:MarR family winged helix-turn-helix transcriptional regulator n=1 Tax=Sphingopyxis sp. TaxID=1908224 RepID=UPI002620987B|nr:winged helix DNA-binding protein [Sphingopyxis sp.]MCW0199139.1 winged helix DNA-binding protein [Sphingopyxis sp.]HMN53990.1 winged helix DNA-binding protein [Sphingopyxis sp.]